MPSGFTQGYVHSAFCFRDYSKLLQISRLCSSYCSAVLCCTYAAVYLFSCWTVSGSGVSHTVGRVSTQNLVFHHCGSFFSGISSLFFLLDSHHPTAAVLFLNLIWFLTPVRLQTSQEEPAWSKTPARWETRPRAIPFFFLRNHFKSSFYLFLFALQCPHVFSHII